MMGLRMAMYLANRRRSVARRHRVLLEQRTDRAAHGHSIHGAPLCVCCYEVTGLLADRRREVRRSNRRVRGRDTASGSHSW